MTTLTDILVQSVEGIGVLGQFDAPLCVNYKPGTDKRGFFSVVFQARCRVTGKDVAIKFFDLRHMMDTYRMDSFDREPELLKKVLGVKRCLQLIQPIEVHVVNIPAAGGVAVPLPAKYFVTDWIPYDIDAYFFEQDICPAIERLRTFRNILLAVEVLHRHQIYHRDIKYDNMRSFSEDTTGPVVVIDFGTATKLDSTALKSSYGSQVGAKLYSGPEAFVGFAGERRVSKYTDFYALGALLYELFNVQCFFDELVNRVEYQAGFNLVYSKVAPETDIDKKIQMWSTVVPPLKNLVKPPTFLGVDNTVPVSIAEVLTQLYTKLVEFDFRNRLSSFEKIRSIIDRSISILANNEKEIREIERRRAMRKARQEKAIRQEERLNAFLNRARGLR